MFEIVKKEVVFFQWLFSGHTHSIIVNSVKNNKESSFSIFPKDFKTTVLKAGDAIDILRERGVNVNGFVQKPGWFNFFPGYSYLDYVNMAGGNSAEGDVDKAIVRHLDGTIENGEKAVAKRGDVIIVPRTRTYILFGNMSALQILSAVAIVVLTFIASR